MLYVGTLGSGLQVSENNGSSVFVELLRGRDGLPGRDGAPGLDGAHGPRDLLDQRELKDPGGTEDTEDLTDPLDQRDPLDPRELTERTELLDLLDRLDLKDLKDMLDLLVHKETLVRLGHVDFQVLMDPLDQRNRLDPRELMELTELLDLLDLLDLKDPLDLQETLVLQVEGLSTPGGERALVHQQQAPRWSTLASWREQSMTYLGLELTICVCLGNESTVTS